MLQRWFTAVLVVIATLLVWKISQVEYWSNINWVLLAVLLLDVGKEEPSISWKKFLPRGVLLLGLLFGVYRLAPVFWGSVSSWEVGSVNHLLNWNSFFASLPLNDGAIFRIYQPDWLTHFMRWVYSYGFSLTLWLAVIRSFGARSGRKMIQYTLSTHVLQLPIIFLFYMTIELQEVWYILGHPDGMNRNFPPDLAPLYVQNCFPSMHTSVSFAVLLLALREKGKIFKWMMVAYCSMVIFSTMYLEIHWVLDVLGGMVLGYFAVKLGDLVISLFTSRKQVVEESITSPVNMTTNM